MPSLAFDHLYSYDELTAALHARAGAVRASVVLG